MWTLNEKANIAMSCLPKNGSTSMRNCNPTGAILKNEEVLSVPVRVAWIRNPLDRMQSAYSFFFYLNERGSNGRTIPSIDDTRSWENFVDLVLTTENMHWCKQVEALTHDGIYVPTVTHKFEDIMELWGNYLPGLLPWQNACSKLPINDYRSDDIEEYYKEDFKIWRGL